ncbi:MAG: hypothetical protein ABF335_07250 [Alphaproteobacteria bacterium]
MKHLAIFCTTLFATALVAVEALAYVGPGAGISAIGSLLALIGAVLLAIVGFVWYPVKRMIKRRKAENDTATNDTAEQDNNAA